MSLPHRDEVPAGEKWDPSIVFDSPADWDAAADAVERRLDDLEAYEGRAVESGETLADLLELVEDLRVVRRGELWLYALLTAYVDTTDDAARQREARYRELDAAMDEALSFLEPELRRAGRDRVDDLVASTPRLADFAAYLDRLLAGADHALSPAAESALASVGPSLRAGSDVSRAITDGDVATPTVETPDGDSVTLTSGTVSRLLQSRDRAFRREVYERRREALTTHRHGMAAAYVERVRADTRLAEVRGYDSALSMRLEGRFPVDAYETVVDGVLDRLDPHHRLLAARDRVVEGDDLRPWDRHVPLAAGDPPEVPYEEATDLLCAALAPLGAAYVDRLRSVLDERRIDVRATTNKRRGPKAMALTSVANGPFVALNYDGGLRAFYLFAHELGHVMHRLLASDEQRPVDQAIPDHVAEVPSFVHETLVADYLAETWEGADARHAVAVFLDKLPTYRAARGARFVHGLHRAVADGADPGPDDLDDRHRSLVDTVREPITPDERTGAGWQEIDRSRDPYHAYLYAVGSVGALSLTRALREDDLTPEQYREMLARGRSVRPNEAFAPTLDFTDEATVARGVRAYAERVDRLLDSVAAAE
ncbi:M3 family oligoendopeptidase [Halobaculum limi]|uniref:M3 family oligoendopeptidase n=1 Tax=Halobaculum limi TaxID=3031916 RepID=UPI00240699A1|nr:M3 family metallopeptidase [Halobaculum sp. YSMS11]